MGLRYCSLKGSLAGKPLRSYPLFFRHRHGYEKTVTRLNKFLGLDLAGLFTSWMGNEIAIVKPAVDQENRLDNLILAIRAKDICEFLFR